ncbi:hypothetical protein DASC09_015900 [Saccharomycopsis crataegensis]|uniref:Deacetylase sirtuin-type domain-containing protein n=1 Tax=Saccharomycopsis crataegensis TaxID=43959 RepID=A0AAV5QIQ8_9ASCO|nr:hypothetical protein DASC09_015900 [Saccharomycopsis crataegensis]
MPTQIDKDYLRSFQNYLMQCNNIIVLVGAGLSAASGVQTYQNSSGYWKDFHSIDISTPDAFLDNPGLVWQFYSWRRHRALKAKPNKGHYAIAALSEKFNSANNNERKRKNNKQCLTINQNVDGLNLRAGHDKANLLELHGNLFDLRCTDFFCSYRESNNFEHPLTQALGLVDDESDKGDDTYEEHNRNKKRRLDREKGKVNTNLSKEDLPACPRCGGLLRPGVVWFGESIPLKAINTIDDFFVSNKIDLILVVGTSGKMWPAIGYVERVRLQGGKIAIFNTEVNSDEISNDKDCWGFEGDASETLGIALEPVIGRNYVPRNYRKR